MQVFCVADKTWKTDLVVLHADFVRLILCSVICLHSAQLCFVFKSLFPVLFSGCVPHGAGLLLVHAVEGSGDCNNLKEPACLLTGKAGAFEIFS